MTLEDLLKLVAPQLPFTTVLVIIIYGGWKGAWLWKWQSDSVIALHEQRLKTSTDACQEWKDIALKSLDAAKTTASTAEKIATVRAVAKTKTE